MWGEFKVGRYVYICVNVCVCGYACMYICMCLCMCMYMYICMCMYVNMYVCVSLCIYIYICLCVCVYVYIYMCVCVYMCVYVYMYICICLDISYLFLLSGLGVVGTLFLLLGISDFNFLLTNDIFDWFIYFVVIFCSIRLFIIFYCKYY